MEVPPDIEVTLEKEAIIVNRISDSRKARSYHGLVRTLVGNMVKGVSTGLEKVLEVSGVGYRAETSSDRLRLVIGFSSPVEYVIPKGIQSRLTNWSISRFPVSISNSLEVWRRKSGH